MDMGPLLGKAKLLIRKGPEERRMRLIEPCLLELSKPTNSITTSGCAEISSDSLVGYGLDPDYLRRVESVSASPDTYLDQFDVETDDWRFNMSELLSQPNDFTGVIDLTEEGASTTIPETPADSPPEPVTPFIPTEAAPGQKIKNPAELEENRFPDITPPTAEEEIALSTKEWRRLKNLTDEDTPPYEFDGEVLIRFNPSPSDAEMQPIASLITASSTATESAGDFMDMGGGRY